MSPGKGRLRQRSLFRKVAAGPQPFQHVAQVQPRAARGRTPDGCAGPGQRRVALQRQQRVDRGAGQQPAGVPEPHLVGREDEDGPGQRPLAQPPQALGKGRAVGGGSLPHHAQGPAAGQQQGGVQGRGPVQAQSHRAVGAGDGGRQPVDGGYGVQPLQQDAPPLLRHRTAAEQAVNGRALVLSQPTHPDGGEAVAAGRGSEVRRVGNGIHQPVLFQPVDGLVDRAPGPAGDGGHLLPVQEGRLRQQLQQFDFQGGGPHGRLSPRGSAPFLSASNRRYSLTFCCPSASPSIRPARSRAARV